MVNFELDMFVSKNEMVKLLEVMQYCLVMKMICFGEFIVQVNSIEMICCLFDFLDSKEGQVCVWLMFSDGCLEIIVNLDNNCQFGFFCFDLWFIIMFFLLNGEQCLFVLCSGFLDLLVDMLLVMEDCYFYEYDGISFYFIGCVVLVNLMVGCMVQGVSMLIQQLVKNLFFFSERLYWCKVNEVYMVLIMDVCYSKDCIFELYMNEVYFG